MDNAIGRVVSILSIPYGYTVSLWCAGALAVIGRPHLDAEVPMRVPAVVVANALPLVVVLVVVVLPLGFIGRRIGFFAASFVATAVYMVSIAAVIRLAKGGGRTG